MSASHAGEAVLEDGGMIVPPKKEPVQVKFRWDPDLPLRIKRMAERTGRTMNDAGAELMKWALDRAEAELEALEQTDEAGRRKRQ